MTEWPKKQSIIISSTYTAEQWHVFPFCWNNRKLQLSLFLYEPERENVDFITEAHAIQLWRSSNFGGILYWYFIIIMWYTFYTYAIEAKCCWHSLLWVLWDCQKYTPPLRIRNGDRVASQCDAYGSTVGWLALIHTGSQKWPPVSCPGSGMEMGSQEGIMGNLRKVIL